MGGHTNEQVQVSPGDVVLDTCVLMDILFAERARHDRARELADVLRRSGRTAYIPAHAYFELVSAVACEKRRNRNVPLTATGARDNLLPFRTVIVAVDLQFVDDYLVTLLRNKRPVDVSGADMIFAVVALKHNLVLISEERKLRGKAKEAGVEALGAEEYLSRIWEPDSA